MSRTCGGACGMSMEGLLGEYEYVKDLGSGNFGVAKLMRRRGGGGEVAIKMIARGKGCDTNVMREVEIQRQLRHPCIVAFYEVRLTPTHLAIVMEYAAGGELFDRILEAGRFSEAEARYYFQQLLSGVAHCHKRGICHRDLKLENVLLDKKSSASGPPMLKICDFGYSKSTFLHSQPKSTVGTPAYIAPEVLQRKAYDGKLADVWSCGVTLYVMLVGSYPFEDERDPRNFRKTIQKIMAVDYSFPAEVRFVLSDDCIDLFNKIFIANPTTRITVERICCHPFYMTDLPAEVHALNAEKDTHSSPQSLQSKAEIDAIMLQAQTLDSSTTTTGSRAYDSKTRGFDGGSVEMLDALAKLGSEDMEP